jgi:nucleotide-binding universal stress UspA family protein
MKILLPVDGSENSILAVREAALRACEPNSEAKIIHVVESPIPVTDMMGVNTEITRDAHNEAVKKGREILENAERILADAKDGLRVTSEIITANPFHSAAEEIVNAAEREGSDLIVMGSRGLSAWKRLVVGSVSQAVIQHAPCSVAIVRPKRHV